MVACAVRLLMLLSPAEAVELYNQLEQCCTVGLSSCAVGLLGKDASAGSLRPLFMQLTVLPQRLETSIPAVSNQRLEASIPQAALTGSALAGPPRIQAAGAVPERHADRVVAEMLRWIVAERRQRMAALKGIFNATPDANPQEQEELVDKFKRIGRKFFPLVTLVETRKRGIWIVSIDGWDRDAHKLIFNSDEIPERPQLAASIIVVKGLGNYQRKTEIRVSLIASHHSLSRLVQRSENRTADDLLAAVTSLFRAYAEAGFQIDGNESRLRFRTNGGDVIAQLERHRDGSGKVVVKTILEI
jgi:hypothetical protein